jgi:CheY-like chemotaxis protein/two-component sensor histidine kinase
MKSIEDSGRHLLDLINDILDLSKIEAAQLELQISTVSLADICMASLQLTKGMAGKRHQRVSYAPLIQPVLLNADARRLKQVLVNLLSNAIKFTPEGGELGLEVNLLPAENKVKLVVWDKGIGIKPEDMNKLFKPFVQIDSSLARQYSGTGLGLSLVQRLVELHNGSVELESTFGEGSRFIVTLPWYPQTMADFIAERKLNSNPEAAPEAAPSAVTLPTVLVADDNETLLDMISEFLRTKQFRVVTVQSGIELLNRVNEVKPDILLVDIQMPGMDGLETIRHIRKHESASVSSVPIIALTALSMTGDRERCLEAGANEYISKPLKLSELVGTINTLIKAV